MSLLILLVQGITTAAAVVVAWRAIMVVNGMAHDQRGQQPLWAWLGFGFGYVLVACAALGSLPMIWATPMQLGYVVWSLGSAALICCDRRRRSRRISGADRAAIDSIISGKTATNDPQQVIQFDSFADLCGFRGGTLAGTRLCRHPPRGPLAVCEQGACPVMNGKKNAA